MRQDQIRLNHEESTMKEKIKDNTTKIKDNKQLPYLVAKVVEVGEAPSLPPLETRLLTWLSHPCHTDPGH